MPDTVGSSLWLSLVDMLVVCAVLALLMVICYGLKLFSRGSLSVVVADQDKDDWVDVAAGDEPASETPMIQSASRAFEGSQRSSADECSPCGAATEQSRVYRMTVNGKTFDVGVECIAGARPVSPVAAVSAPVAHSPVLVPSSSLAAFRSTPSHRPASTSNIMKSPLPGKILKVLAAPGKAFKRGDTLLVIEAMKMENEILAPRDCVIGEVHVEVNQSVKTGEPLLGME
ncbi:MAG: biotin/lipoyl-containing protein [Candidatus Cryosericum sp.]